MVSVLFVSISALTLVVGSKEWHLIHKKPFPLIYRVPLLEETDKHPHNGLLSRTTWVSLQLKDKPFWILMKQEMVEWQRHQLTV